MIRTGELKQRARECLKHYYWWAFLACLLTGLLGGKAGSAGIGGSGSGLSFNVTKNVGPNQTIKGAIEEEIAGLDPAAVLAFISVFTVIMLVAWLVAILWGTFVGNVIQVGCCRYFMESRERMQSAGIGRLFYGFESGNYLNVVKTMFIKGLFTFLWSLLLIIPGIIKHYEYAMVPYILSDQPQMDYRDALGWSRDMMKGYKWKLFVLQLSFIGWIFLGSCCCGIGVLFVNPYMEASVAEFYAQRRMSVWDQAEGDQPRQSEDGYVQ